MFCHIQIAKGAPGEVFLFNVTAIDQAGNQQAAVWNVNKVDENETENEVNKYIDNFNTTMLDSVYMSVIRVKLSSLYQLREEQRCITLGVWVKVLSTTAQVD